MPNPLTKLQRNISKRENIREGIPPVPEEYEPQNLPYRGPMHHGVMPDPPSPDPADWEDGRPVEYHEPLPGPEPIPVRIVNESGTELRLFRTYGEVTGVNTGEPRMIVGRDEERSLVRVKHIVSSATVWISHAPETCNSREGYPLLTGDEWSSITQMPIYAWADSATPLDLSISVESASEV